MKRRVAILGGTFDPIHRGHLVVLQQVVEVLGADAGWLMVAGAPWHRRQDTAPAAIRMAMAATAAPEFGLEVCDIELARSGPSYTIDSLHQLQRIHLDTDFHFVVGADTARLVHEWHRSIELLTEAHFVIVNRTGAPRLDVTEAVNLGFSQARTRLLQVHSPEISASQIRAAVAAGEPLEGLVPPKVAALISREHLYRQPNVAVP